jgi:tRNA threonylcarbamoyladenosine biosynthesis protein TsaB
MRVLAIDCSTEWLAVALGDAGGFRERREHAGQTHSERVLPIVDALLAEAGWRLADLGGIAFGSGPGSFTGVRIACGVAQGLALGTGLPLAGVPSLLAVAQDAHRTHGAARIFACTDARMKEVYVAAYERADEGWREVSSPAVIAPADVVVPAGQWFAAGDGLAAYPAIAERRAFAGIDPAVRPSARAIGELGRAWLVAGLGVTAAEASPLYVRHRVALTTAEQLAGARL